MSRFTSRWRTVVGSSLAVLVVAVASGCGGDDDKGGSAAAGSTTKTEAKGPGKRTIGVVNVTGAAEASSNAAAGAVAAAKALGWDIEVLDSQFDPQKANAQYSQLASKKVDAIVSVSWEPAVVQQGLQAAKRAEIPVVNISGSVNTTPLLPSNITADELEVSKIGLDYMFERIPKGAQIAASADPAFAWGTSRAEALEGALKERPDIKLVGEPKPFDHANPVKHVDEWLSQVFRQNPKVDGLWLAQSDAGPHVARWLKNKGKCNTDLVVVGQLGDLANLKGIRDGCLTAVGDLSAEAQGWAAIDVLATHFAKGTEIPAVTPDYARPLLAPTMIDKENVPSGAKERTKPPVDFEQFFKDRWAEELGV
jgi:ribose transport system substrate-binding protein